MTITQDIAEFATKLMVDELPQPVVDKAKTALLHNLSVAMAGTEMTAHLGPYVRTTRPGPDGGARRWGTGERTSPEVAAFVNAATMHARTQDDTHFPALTHIGSTLLPALLAVGEEISADGATLVRSMVAGYEAAAAIGTGVAAVTTSRGFRSTALFGSFGSATAVGCALGLDTAQLTAALGLAAATVGGTNQTWVAGTQEWMYQTATAARNGIVAARLAQLGATSAADAIEGPAGLYANFVGEPVDTDRTGHLGSRWLIHEVTFKPFPVCAINQVPVTEAIELALKHDLSPESIRSATLYLSPVEASYPGTDCVGPFSDVGATLMSAQFCLAVALTERTVRLTDMRRFEDAALLRLAGTMTVVSDPTLKPLSSRLDVILHDGTELHTSYDATSQTFNWTHGEVADRARALVAESVLDPAATERLIDITRDLEHHTIRDLINVIAGA